MEMRDVPGSGEETRTARETRWVVGVDGSECSHHAALWATEQAIGRARDIHLVTAWSIPTAITMTPMGASTVGSTADALEQAAASTVDELDREISATLTIPVRRSVLQGGAARRLLESARDSSLLVVGSRGHGGFGRLVLGSTSTQCATHSTRPVAVVPATAPIAPITSIVVGFDGSANSIAALEWAIDFAAPGSMIHCVSVWDAGPIAIGADRFFFPEASELAEERFQHLVTRTVTPIERHDVDVRRTFVEGRPREMLADFAASGDLLVTGARGHGAIGAAMLGSVSTWLLHNARPPIVVVPLAADAVDDRPAERDGNGERRQHSG